MKRKEIKKVRHSRRFLPGISLLYVVSQIRKILHLIKDKKAGDPRVLRTATPGMTALFNKGFALIELLVVVLIIGILAAVALPQYQRAVEKSRAAQAVLLVRSLARAQEVYYLANGAYATSFEDLDIQIPPSEGACQYAGESAYTVQCYRIGDWDVMIEGEPGQTDPVFSVAATQGDVTLISYLDQKKNDNEVRAAITGLACTTKTDKGKTLCSVLGGQFLQDAWGTSYYDLY